MRPIKFRAWDKREKKMWTVEDIVNSKLFWAVGFHGLPVAMDSGSFRDGEIIGWNIDHFIELMQFTGLKDKNGKEIYEGDIVKNTNSFSNSSPYAIDFGIQEFADDAYGEVCAGWNVPLVYVQKITAPCPCEVIGNVYENPELLP